MTGIIKFFKQNPKDLLSLIPKNKEEEFYSKIRQTAFENYESGKELNTVKKIETVFPYFETKFGKICLN